MSAKNIFFGSDARAKMLSGVNKLVVIKSLQIMDQSLEVLVSVVLHGIIIIDRKQYLTIFLDKL